MWVLHGHVLDKVGDAMSADALDRFWRLFGDVTGSGLVTSWDYAQWRAAYGKHLGDPGYVWYLDYDGNGVLDLADGSQILKRLGKQV